MQYEKKTIIVDFKDDLIFNISLGLLYPKFYSISDDMKKELRKEQTKLERAGNDISKKISDILSKFVNSIQYAIDEGRVKMEFDTKRKGGYVYFLMKGTPEEIKEWTKSGITSKAGLKALSKWIGIEVVDTDVYESNKKNY